VIDPSAVEGENNGKANQALQPGMGNAEGVQSERGRLPAQFSRSVAFAQWNFAPQPGKANTGSLGLFTSSVSLHPGFGKSELGMI
jgi:hypothetical protein